MNLYYRIFREGIHSYQRSLQQRLANAVVVAGSYLGSNRGWGDPGAKRRGRGFENGLLGIGIQSQNFFGSKPGRDTQMEALTRPEKGRMR